MNRIGTNGTPSITNGRKKVHTRRASVKPQRKLALAVGGVGAFVLFLSVWECTTALNSLTGMPYLLAGLLAIGIDLGMVVSEMAAVVASKDQDAHLWAERYIGLSVGLSVVLNAAAAASHTSGLWIGAAIAVGGLIPVFVFVAGRTAGALYTGK
jgi:hypothetical protein